MAQKPKFMRISCYFSYNLGWVEFGDNPLVLPSTSNADIFSLKFKAPWRFKLKMYFSGCRKKEEACNMIERIKLHCARMGHRVGRVLSFFFSRRNWESPNPSPAGVCACPPPPPGTGGRRLLVGERGVGRVPIPTRVCTCSTLYIYALCGMGR
jgi:hypothetical protein